MNRIDTLRLGAATGICLSVLAIVLYETFDGRTAEIQQEPAPVIEPWLIAAVFALGALIILTDRLRVYIGGRGSASRGW